MTDNNTDGVLDLTPVKFEVNREYDYEKILFGLFFICLALRQAQNSFQQYITMALNFQLVNNEACEKKKGS